MIIKHRPEVHFGQACVSNEMFLFSGRSYALYIIDINSANN